MSTGPLISGSSRKTLDSPSPRAQDEEQLRIDAALAYVREHGNLDDFPADRNERRALIVTSVRRGLVAWDRRRERYELTGSGRAQLAGYAAKVAETPAQREPPPIKVEPPPPPIRRPPAPVAVRRPTGRPMAIAAIVMLAACSGVAAGALLQSSRNSPSGSAEAIKPTPADTSPAATDSAGAARTAATDRPREQASSPPLPEPRPGSAPAAIVQGAPAADKQETTATVTPSTPSAPAHNAAATEAPSPAVDTATAKPSGGSETTHAAMTGETSQPADAKRSDRHSRHDRYARSHRSKMAGDWFRRQERADRRYGEASAYEGRNGFAYNTDDDEAPSYRAGRYRGYRDGPPVIMMRRPPPVDAEARGPSIFGWLYH